MKTSSERQNAHAANLQRYSLHGETMGTRYSAVFFAAPGADEAAIDARLFAAVEAVDRQMSSWKPDSDLNRINGAPVDQWLAVPEQLLTVLEAALEVGRQSHGAFDIGVGDLVSAWGFGVGQGHVDERQINALEAQAYRPAIDVLDLDSVQHRVRKRAAVTLDLSGIAKGYGVDQLARCLDGFRITRYLVGIDGEMRAPASSRLAAVSVVASSCMHADAWATALLVLGEKAGIELARERAMTALFVLHDGDGFQEISITEGNFS